MADATNDPFAGFKTTKAYDGVTTDEKPTPKQAAPASAPEEGDDPLAEFKDQGGRHVPEVPDDDDGAADADGDADTSEDDEEHEGSGDEDGGVGEDDDEGEEDPIKAEAKRLAQNMAKKRIAELTKLRRTSEAEVERLRRENEELKAKSTPPEKPGEKEGEQAEAAPPDDIVVRDVKGNVLDEPNPSKYRYGEVDSQYLKDVVNYQTAYARAVVQHEAEQTRQAEAAEAQLQELRNGWTTTMESGRASYGDFDEVVLEAGDRGDYPLTKTTFEIAAASEFGADILYHLATNPQTAANVAGMSDRDQARYLGRLEAAIETSRKKQGDKGKQQQRKAPSAAPPPSRPTPRGRGGKFVNPAQSSNFADFEAAVKRHEERNKR